MCTMHRTFLRQNISFPLLDFTQIIISILEKKSNLKSIVIPTLKHDSSSLVKPTLSKSKLLLLVVVCSYFLWKLQGTEKPGFAGVPQHLVQGAAPAAMCRWLPDRALVTLLQAQALTGVKGDLGDPKSQKLKLFHLILATFSCLS